MSKGSIERDPYRFKSGAKLSPDNKVGQKVTFMTKTNSEHALAVIKAGLNAVPVIGGSIASLISDYVSTATQKSKDAALEDLRVQLEKLQDRIDVEAVDRDQFSELFKSAYLVMVRTHNEHKLHAATRLLVNLLLREGDPEKLGYTELDHYARCLDLLSVGAIAVLGHAVAIAIQQKSDDIETRSTPITFEQLQERMSDMAPSLLMGLIGELDTVNLIHRPGAPSIRTPDYQNYPLELTPLGAKFTCRLLELDIQ